MLDGDESAGMEGPINEEEINNALKEMDSNRSPGHDDFPVEFYIHF